MNKRLNFAVIAQSTAQTKRCDVIQFIIFCLQKRQATATIIILFVVVRYLVYYTGFTSKRGTWYITGITSEGKN
jgi:hypothetical protein